MIRWPMMRWLLRWWRRRQVRRDLARPTRLDRLRVVVQVPPKVDRLARFKQRMGKVH